MNAYEMTVLLLLLIVASAFIGYMLAKMKRLGTRQVIKTDDDTPHSKKRKYSLAFEVLDPWNNQVFMIERIIIESASEDSAEQKARAFLDGVIPDRQYNLKLSHVFRHT